MNRYFFYYYSSSNLRRVKLLNVLIIVCKIQRTSWNQLPLHFCCQRSRVVNSREHRCGKKEKTVPYFLSLLITLPMERSKGVGFLDQRSLMGREALFVFNPVINLTMIILYVEEGSFMYILYIPTHVYIHTYIYVLYEFDLYIHG